MVKIILTILLCLITTNSYAENLLFVTNWCGYCVPIKQYAKELQLEGYDIKIINCDTNRELANKYHITSVPTLIITTNTLEIGSPVGGWSKDRLRRFLTSYMFNQNKFNLDKFTGAVYFHNSDPEIIARALRYGYLAIDVNKHSDLVKKFNITTSPTLLVLIRGRVVTRVEG